MLSAIYQISEQNREPRVQCTDLLQPGRPAVTEATFQGKPVLPAWSTYLCTIILTRHM